MSECRVCGTPTEAPATGGHTNRWCSASCRRAWKAEQRRHEREVDRWAEMVAEAESEMSRRPHWAKAALAFRSQRLEEAAAALDEFLARSGVEVEL